MKATEFKQVLCYKIALFLRNPFGKMHPQIFDALDQWHELTDAERAEIISYIAEYNERSHRLCIIALCISCASLIINAISIIIEYVI